MYTSLQGLGREFRAIVVVITVLNILTSHANRMGIMAVINVGSVRYLVLVEV